MSGTRLPNVAESRNSCEQGREQKFESRSKFEWRTGPGGRGFKSHHADVVIEIRNTAMWSKQRRHGRRNIKRRIARTDCAKYWEIIADNLSEAGWTWGCVAAVDSRERTIFVSDAYRDDGKRFIVRGDEKQSAFMELESLLRAGQPLAASPGSMMRSWFGELLRCN